MHDTVQRPLSQLQGILLQMRWRSLADLGLRTGVVLLGCLLLIGLGLYSVTALDWPSWIGLAVGVGLAGVWALKLLDLKTWRSSLSRSQFVLDLERAQGLERGALLSPLQIAESHCKGQLAGAESLIQGALAEATQLAQRLPSRPLGGSDRRPLAGLTLLGLVFAGLLAWDGSVLYRAWSGLDGSEEADLVFRVWTAREVVARGESTEVFVRRLAPLRDPLFLSSTEETGLEASWESWPLPQPQPGQTGAKEQPLYRVPLGPLNASRRIFVSSGPFSSKVIELKVEDRPRLVGFRTETRFPEYLGMAPLAEDRTDGNITAAWGAKVRLMVESDLLLQSARMLLGAERKVLPMRVLENRSRAEIDLDIQTDDFYEIEITSVAGLTNLPVRYHIKPLEDRSPTVRILKPGRDLTMDQQQTVTLDVAAEDDHRIDRLELVYSIDQEPEQSIPLTIQPGPKHRLEYVWDLSALGLSFEQEASYYVAAWDNDTLQGPKRGVSSTYKLRYPSFYDIYDQAEQQQSQDIDSVAGLVEKQKQLLEDLDRMASKLAPDTEMDWKQSEELRDMEARQKEVQSEVQSLAQELKDQLEKLEKDSLASKEVQEKTEEISKLFQQLADEDMQKILEQIQDALSKLEMDEEQLAELQKNMSTDQLMQGLDRTLELLKRLEAERQLEALSELAQQLAEQQEKLAEASEQLVEPAADPNTAGDPNQPSAPETAGDPNSAGDPNAPGQDDGQQPQDPKSQDPNAPGQADSQKPQDPNSTETAGGQKSQDSAPKKSTEELARKQRELAPQLEALEKDLSKLNQSDALKSIQEELDKLQKELGDPSEDAEQAGEQLQKNDPGSASKIQRPLSQKLKKLSGALGQMAQQMQGMQLAEILAIIEELVHELVQVTQRLDTLRGQSLALADLSRFSVLSSAERNHIGHVAKEVELGHQASKAILERIVELGSKSPQLSQSIAGRVEEATEGLRQAQNSIETLSMGSASTYFLDSRIQLHEAAVALLSLSESLSQGMPSAGQSLRESLEQLSEDQRRLAESMKRGQKEGQGLVPMPMPRSMQEMAAEQARIRRQMESIRKDFEALQGSMGSLEGLEDDMKDLENQYKDGALKPDAEEKQKKILDKLLEAKESLRERKLDPQRESKTGEELTQQPPASKPVEDPWEQQLRGLMDNPEAELSAEDRQILERYYLRLAEEEP